MMDFARLEICSVTGVGFFDAFETAASTWFWSNAKTK
jgi:hypothetical protein